MPQRLGLTLSPSRDLPFRNFAQLVGVAEQAGYDSVWVPETWGADAASVLAALAGQTSTIRLASGVFNVFSRSAALIAQTAATLQELSGGRFILGLGTSGPVVIEDWHATSYARPLARTRDYVAAVRMALSGEKVDYSGATITMRSFRLSNAPAQPIPIYIAALGPKNLELTGEIADGWLPIFAGRGRLAGPLEVVHSAAREAGRKAEDIQVAAYLPFVIGPRAERLLRQQLAYYVGAMGTYYFDFVTRLGFGTQADEIRRRWQIGDRVGAARAVGDELLDTCTLGTSIQEAKQRIAAFRQEGVDLPILAMPNGASFDEFGAALMALAPAGTK